MAWAALNRRDDILSRRPADIAQTRLRPAAQGAKRVHAFVATLILFLMEQNATYLLFNPVTSNANFFVYSEAGRLVDRAVTYIIFASMMLVVSSPIRGILQELRRQVLLVVLITFTIASTLWSITPGVTFMRSISLVPPTLFGIYLALRFDTRELLSIALRSLRLCFVLSLFIILVVPSIGVSAPPHIDAWRGIFAHRNTLGMMCYINFIVLGGLASDARTRRSPAFYADVALTALLLYGSGSKTPVFVVLTVLAMITLLYSIRRSMLLFIPHALLVFGSALLLILNFEALLQLIGREPTLSGRALLWQTIWTAIQNKILLGYGFEAFWANAMGPVQYVWQTIGWQPTEAHSLYLDVWLSIGALGLLLLVLLLGQAFIRAWFKVRHIPLMTAVWVTSWMFSIIMVGFVESYLFSPTLVTWPLMVATLVMIRQGGARAAGSTVSWRRRVVRHGPLAPPAGLRRNKDDC